MNPGMYLGMPMAEYLAIDALSKPPVQYALEECPRAGWWHSRLNPRRQREVSEAMDLGTIAHGVLLEGSTASAVIIDPADYPTKSNGNIPKGWTNNEIRAARDAARAAGKCPILLEDYAEVENMITVAQEFIGSLQTTEPAIWRAFQPDGGASEVTILWEENGQLCKLRTDRSALDFGVVIDYKTSAQSVEPGRFGRSMLAGSTGYAFGAAWYRRGIRAETGINCDYVFLAQEKSPPYLCSLVGVDPAWMALAGAKVEAGLRLWAQCVRTGQWDAYPNRVCYPELPPWESARGEEMLAGIPYDYATLTGRDKPEFLK